MKSEWIDYLNSCTQEELEEVDRLLASVNHELFPFRGEPQEEFVYARGGELFYGGARGGAKTHGLLLSYNGFRSKWSGQGRGVIFRRSMPELEEIIELSQSLFPFTGGVYEKSRKTWRWPDGDYLRLRFLDRDSDARKYQGHNLNWIGIDEAGSFSDPAPINRLRGSLRSSSGVKPEMRLTGNPGGPGHSWLKDRYVTGNYEDRQDWYVKYIHATIKNNPAIMENDPGYIDRLRDSGPDWLVRAWIIGDWDINPGGFFDGAWNNRRQVLKPFMPGPKWPVYLGFDWGFSKPSALIAIAISPGVFADTVSGETTYLPPGSPVLFRELYTVAKNRSGQDVPNRGTREDNEQLGKMAGAFVERLRMEGANIVSAVADSSIFSGQGGRSIYAQMCDGWGELEFTACKKSSRPARASDLFKLMRAGSMGRVDTPGLFMTANCKHCIRTIPTAPADPHTFDDVDTSSEDHTYDAVCYGLEEVDGLGFSKGGGRFETAGV